MSPPTAAASSPSLFELPVARGPRLARIFVVVTLNLILAGAGVAMIVSYLAKRAEAEKTQGEPAKRVEAPVDTGEDAATTAGAAPDTAGVAEPGDTVLAASVGASAGPSQSRKNAAETSKRPRPSTSAAAVAAKPDGSKADAGAVSAGDAAVDKKGAGAGASSETAEYAAQIDALASRNQQQLHRCYQQAAKTMAPEQSLEGRVDIRFRIMPDGRATGGRVVANTTGSEVLGACLVDVVEGWSFPPGASRPLDFVWPFRFRSRAP